MQTEQRDSTNMPLIILYIGNNFSRFPTEKDARKAGELNHTEYTPAKIEIIPDNGGIITKLIYDKTRSEWLPYN